MAADLKVIHIKNTLLLNKSALKQLESPYPDLVHFAMVQQPVWYNSSPVVTMQDLITARFRNPDQNPVVFWIKQQIYKWVNKTTIILTVKMIWIKFNGVNPEKNYCNFGFRMSCQKAMNLLMS